MKKWKYNRFFEILPGAIVWVILIVPVVLSVFAPAALAMFMIFFISFWLVKVVFMSGRMIIGYIQYKNDMAADWFSKLQSLAPENSWKKIYHLVIVPTLKEDISILRCSVESVIKSNYPKENIIYVLATEERDKENAEKYTKILEKEYGGKIKFFSFMHPDNIAGEIKGKGPNIVWAAKHILPYIKKLAIPFENVVVTNMDADHIMDRQYLACLTYKYITDPDPVHKTFQPLPMFFNNIWDAPMLTRYIAMGSSFWQLVVSTRPSRLKNFSAQAQSLEALEQVDFWSTTTIVEDGHQFWRTYYKFNGYHEVVPIYIPIYQDAVLGDNLKETIKEQYLQKRRWSWGVSDIPYVMEHTFRNKKIPLVDRWANALILWEAHITWSTNPLLLATASWLPFVFRPDFYDTVLAFNFPLVYSRLVMTAWIGMIVSLLLSTLMVPPRRGKKPVGRIVLDWILTPIITPISSILFSAIPALESQTRLMIGKHLGYFRVTKKSTVRSFVTEGQK